MKVSDFRMAVNELLDTMYNDTDVIDVGFAEGTEGTCIKITYDNGDDRYRIIKSRNVDYSSFK